jgi:hypothetical protein
VTQHKFNINSASIFTVGQVCIDLSVFTPSRIRHVNNSTHCNMKKAFQLQSKIGDDDVTMTNSKRAKIDLCVNGVNDESGGGSVDDPPSMGSMHYHHRRVADKTCRVCGDAAVGFNFEVVTCESCKAFFRRNCTRRADEFKCPYTNNCVITKQSRRSCKHCRLAKCVSVVFYIHVHIVHTCVCSWAWYASRRH